MTSNPGSFHYASGTGEWLWSEELFAILGFAPGDVVPTRELLLYHQHAEDRADLDEALLAAERTGRPFVVWHRVVDAHGATRQVVTVGAGEFADSHADAVGPTGVSGFVVDLTEPLRRETAREVDEALQLMSRSRPAIDQAKGALMFSYALDPDQAFTLLRRYSQATNVKVRDVARAVVESLPDGDLPAGSRPVWDLLAQEVGGSVRPAAQAEETGA